MALAGLFIAPIERSLNACLATAPQTPARLLPLAGRIIDVELIEIGLHLRFLPDRDGVQVDVADTAEPDVRIRGTLPGLIAATLGPAATGMRGVEATGDMDVAQDFTRLLREADIDWEELLATHVGDLAAHQIGRITRSVLDWSRASSQHLAHDLGEYLSEESELVAGREEIAGYLHAVDDLRDDVERAQARVERLRRHMEPRP